MSIELIKSKVSAKQGLARSNLFAITLPSIDGLSGVEELNVLCRDVTLPGRQLLSNERQIGATLEKVAYGYAVQDVSATFLCLNDYYVRKYFETWQGLVVNPDTFELGYKNEYSKDITIHQLQKPEYEISGTSFLNAPKSAQVYGVKLQKAYPTTMTDVQFNNELDGIVELNVQFSYRNWKPIGWKWMALPQINELPRYELTIPSSKQQVSFRPFLVKEQKTLLIALESQDESQILRAVVDTIGTCVYEPIKLETLATFDVEYMFTMIRSKSVGENANVNLKCTQCEEFTEVVIPLEDIQVKIPEETPTVKLNDNYTIQLKYPQYKGLQKELNSSNPDTMADAMIDMIILCLDKLRTEDELINFANETKENIITFIESLNTQQFENLINFVQGLPKLSHDVLFKCDHCDKDNKVLLQGLQDFF